MEGGYEALETRQRVELLVYLCEDACETPAVNTYLDEVCMGVCTCTWHTSGRDVDRKSERQTDRQTVGLPVYVCDDCP